MGLLSKIKSKGSDPTSDTSSTITSDSTNPLNPSTNDSSSAGAPRKKSLYEKYQERKRGPGTSNMTDEELFKFTGKTREEFEHYKATSPGVAGGQAAGDLTAGGSSGLGVASGAGEGFGGWGHGAGKVPKERLQKDDGVIR